tara:strand:- start:457 stop:678 length:222 start_codon:yes stop_codon:yes gene_type:complete
MVTLAIKQMTTTNYLEIFTDDIIEAILEQATNNLEKNIKELTNKKHGQIIYQLLSTNSTFARNIRFQLTFEDL